MRLLSLYFSPAGRLSRGGLWLACIGLAILEIVFNAWLEVAIFGRDILDPAARSLEKPAMQLTLLINVIFAFPLFCVLAKRFHDRNKGAIWAAPYLLASLAVIAALVSGQIALSGERLLAGVTVPDVAYTPLGALAAFIQSLMTLWLFVELGFLRGSKGVNRFGPDPLER